MKPRRMGGTAHGVISRTGLGHGRTFRRKVRYSIVMGGPTWTCTPMRPENLRLAVSLLFNNG